MPTITLSVSEDLKKDMESMKDINWSEVTRGLLSEKVKRMKLLRKMDKMLENSKLTDEDALKLGREVNAGMYKRLKKQGMV
ncbi:MAG: hypothetical protein AABX14_02065 [Candidatus Aenigmatarchaeota archaeon]